MSKPIKLRFTYTKLQAFNNVWSLLENFQETTAESKALLSVMQDVSVRFQRKEVNLQYKYDATSEYTIGLKDHEAYFLEKYLRTIVKLLPLGYTRTIVYKYADLLNQKLA